ncbi:hypothetical protein LINGRAPRIM_LOCUS2840 [Linum grandiflorum]
MLTVVVFSVASVETFSCPSHSSVFEAQTIQTKASAESNSHESL